MSGSKQYHEKCVCGATITLTENFDFISSSEVRKLFNEWKLAHQNCLPLFIKIQKVRVKQLSDRAKIKLLK